MPLKCVECPSQWLGSYFFVCFYFFCDNPRTSFLHLSSSRRNANWNECHSWYICYTHNRSEDTRQPIMCGIMSNYNCCVSGGKQFILVSSESDLSTWTRHHHDIKMQLFARPWLTQVWSNTTWQLNPFRKSHWPVLVTFTLLYIGSKVLILIKIKQSPRLSGIISTCSQNNCDEALKTHPYHK